MEDFEDSSQISISDLMAGLMLFFLFISISFMLEMERDRNAIKNIIEIYSDSKKELNRLLHSEFDKDLHLWNAEITDDNIIRFFIPFKTGSKEVPEKFKKVLNEFFPRYIDILTRNRIKQEIQEVRIEGHTSKTWKYAMNKQEIYLKNLELSQQRAKNVLRYLYNINNNYIIKNDNWLEKKFRAIGVAFAEPLSFNGKIDWNKSKRVEFSIQTKDKEKIQKIMVELK